jgi:hypothetical protein
MGKGHGQKKKINDLLLKGNIKGAKELLETSKKRLSRSAHEALSNHLSSKLKLRKKLGAKKFAAQSNKLSKNIKTGMKKSRDSSAFASGISSNATSVPGGLAGRSMSRPAIKAPKKSKKSESFYEGSSGGMSVAGGLPTRASASKSRGRKKR